MAEAWDLQVAARNWHMRRFPPAQLHQVAFKLGEEVGEFFESLNHPYQSDRVGTPPQEAADIVICLMVILGRWFPKANLMDEVWKKLAILTDPQSGHKSAFRE